MIINLKKASEHAIELMNNKEMSRDSIRKYSKIGFPAIIEHFTRIGISSVTPEMLDEYIYEQKDSVENGKIEYKHWKILRYSSELLKSCTLNNSIDIPKGTRWDYLNDYSRYNIWGCPPSEMQLANPGNIYALVWKTGKALETSELSKANIKRLQEQGLRRVLQFHIDEKTEVYSEELVNIKISELHDNYEKGLITSSAFQYIRKSADYVREMHDTNGITNRMLPRWGLREPIEPFKKILVEYVEFEKEAGVLGESSINEMKYRIRTFVFELEDNGYNSMECFKCDIINSIITSIVSRCSYDFSNVVKPIKKFLKFMYLKKYTDTDLTYAIPEFAARKSTFHEGFSKEEVDKLITHPDRTTAIGKRDYAIMLIVAQTGLRGCDVVSLKYENIDWRAREIRLVQRKTNKPIIVPLEPESGNAIAEYILNGRPKSELPYIFLTHDGRKCRPLRCNNGVMIVSRHMKKAGITANKRSVHALRRTYGTRLLQSEVPIEMIRQLLGHSTMDSSKPYLSIDEEGLKKCALSLLSCSKGGDCK